MIDTIIFDMDGVLLDSEPLWLKAQIDTFAKVGIRITPTMHQSTMGLRASQIVEHWHARYPWDTYSKVEIVDLLVQHVLEYIEAEAKPMAGLHDFLEQCHQRKMSLGIFSSSHMKLIRAVVNTLHIGAYIQEYHSGEDEKHGKPHPSGYLHIMQKLHTTPEKSIVIEDSINGAIAGKASGAKLVVIPNPDTQKEDFAFSDKIYPDFMSIKLNELLAL